MLQKLTMLTAAATALGLVGLVSMSGHLHAQGAQKVPLVDACVEIDMVFCDGSGNSDLPDFISGFVIANTTGDGFSMVTVMVRGSEPDAQHDVFLCPGDVDPVGGFTGCQFIGAFTTNIKGNGATHINLDESAVGNAALAINVSPFATVLANDPIENPLAF